MKRLAAIALIALVAASVGALALSAASTHDRTLVALQQASPAESEPPRLRREEAVEQRPSASRPTPRNQDQMLMLLLLLEMGSSTSRP